MHHKSNKNTPYTHSTILQSTQHLDIGNKLHSTNTQHASQKNTSLAHIKQNIKRIHSNAVSLHTCEPGI